MEKSKNAQVKFLCVYISSGLKSESRKPKGGGDVQNKQDLIEA